MKPSTWIVRLLAVAGAAGLARYVLDRRKAIAAVAPELRSPALFAPVSFSNAVALDLMRRAPVKPAPLRPGTTVRETTAPSAAGPVRVLVYEPAGRDRNAGPVGGLVWIHGGGLIFGMPEQGHDVCSHLVADLGIVVVSVDYRLAPEHPFPAGLDDCVAALDWLAASADELGVDRDRLAVGGDSAGGGLAACVAQVSVDRGGPSLRLQLLQYPMLDDRTVLRPQSGPSTLVWSQASNRYAWTAYLGHAPAAQEDRPYASAARRADLAGLAPAWIGVGDIDLFHDEDVEYARRLREAGVPVELHVEPGMYHAADMLAATTPSMQAFRKRMIDAVRDALVPVTV
jgi:acetyl esterase/lipase